MSASLTNAALDAVQALQRAPSVLKIRELLRRMATHHGYDYFLCSSSLPASDAEEPDPAIFQEWPEEFRQLYRRERFFSNDPIVGRLRFALEPFFWSDVPSASYTQSRAAVRVMRAATSFDMNEGFVVPIYGATGHLHCITMAGSQPRHDVAARAELHLISIYAYARAKQLLRRGPEPRVQISKREREALLWVAAGKSDWEIGELLNISESAAHKRIESAKRKFAVATRIQAVVEAFRRGHITF